MDLPKKRIMEMSFEAFLRADEKKVVDELLNKEEAHISRSKLEKIRSAFSFALRAVVLRERAKLALPDKDRLNYSLLIRRRPIDEEESQPNRSTGEYNGNMLVLAFYRGKLLSLTSVQLTAYTFRNNLRLSFEIYAIEELVNVPGFWKGFGFAGFLRSKTKVDVERYLSALAEANEKLFRRLFEEENQNYVFDCNVSYNLPSFMKMKFTPKLYLAVAEALRRGLSGPSGTVLPNERKSLRSFSTTIWSVPKSLHETGFLENLDKFFRRDKSEMLFASEYFREPFTSGVKEHRFSFVFNPNFFEEIEAKISKLKHELVGFPYTRTGGNMRFVFRIGPFGTEKTGISSHGATAFVLDSYSEGSRLFIDVEPYFLSGVEKAEILKESIRLFPMTYEAIFRELITRHGEKPIRMIASEHEGLLDILRENVAGFGILTDDFGMPQTSKTPTEIETVKDAKSEDRVEAFDEEAPDLPGPAR